jgi:hypothetical protein
VALSGLSLLLLSSVGWADGAPDSAACVDAYSKAQTLRNDKKLVEARAALLTCAQPSCKDFIVRDCTDWLEQVRTGLPTVVAVAIDAAGNALVDVKVTVDGAPFQDKIDGRAVPLNPGVHAFKFEAADGTKAEKQIIVAEGEHEKRISVTLGNAAAAPPAGAAAPTASAAPAAAPAGGETGALSEQKSPWKLVGLAAAGVGIAGLATGSVFGIVAMSKKNSASSCDSTAHCTKPEDVAAMKDAGSAASLSTIFFIAGGVLAAGGIAIWAIAPSRYVQASPTVGLGSAGIEVKGAW